MWKVFKLTTRKMRLQLAQKVCLVLYTSTLYHNSFMKYQQDLKLPKVFDCPARKDNLTLMALLKFILQVQPINAVLLCSIMQNTVRFLKLV
jgi:hypothetical protein